MGESISQQHPSHFCITSVQHPCNFPSTCLHRLPTPKLPGTDRFLDHFGTPLGPIFCPSWPHLALPDAIFPSFLELLCPAWSSPAMGESISQQHPSHFCITSVQHPCNFPSTCLHRLPTPKLPGTDRFLDHFGTPLGPIFCPSWPHLALPDAIFTAFLDRPCPA